MTGWTLHLAQDECKALGKWFASRIDARYVLRKGIEMTPREQLEYAAKAMGKTLREIIVTWSTAPSFFSIDEPATPWNPRKDQADSDEMACKLRIEIRYRNGLVFAGLHKWLFNRYKDVRHNNTDEDVCRAVREARLLVAVEIGKGMK